MGKEYGGSPKLHQLESKRKRLTWILSVSALCVLFYMLGAWQNTAPAPSTRSQVYNRVGCDDDASSPPAASGGGSTDGSLDVDFESHHQLELSTTASNSDKPQEFPACDFSFSEYTPCQDPQRGRKFDRC